MSITASYVALTVVILRLLLRRAPKIFSYILWATVAIRLITPISFTSNFSMLGLVKFPNKSGSVRMEFSPQEIPMVDRGIQEVSHFINNSLPAAAPMASLHPMQLILWIGSIIWISGVIILLLFSVLSYLKIVAKVRTATWIKDKFYETDQIDTPFVCGFLSPKIYIPTGMNDDELSYILLHEKIHIKRRDYLIKPFAFLLVILHWFNPIMWVSYALMSKDMEMSCDESVVNKMGPQVKGKYSTSLISLAVGKRQFLTGSPLAFGESNVKARIKNILTYRRPSRWMMVVYVILIAILAISCTSNPLPFEKATQESIQSSYSGYKLDQLMKNKTRYVGDAGRVGGLIGGTIMPIGVQWNGMALQTTTQPYGVTVNYVRDDSTDTIEAREVKTDVFICNSILLLSLIDNVGSITYSLTDQPEPSDRTANTFTFTREQAENLIGEDVRHFAEDETTLRQLIDRLETMDFGEVTSTSEH